MSLEFTLVRRAISLAVIDGPDADDNPDILQAQGSVLFEPVIKKGDSIQVQTRGGSETYALAPIECPINDGIISHRGQDGVKLPAGGEAANPSLIRWKATFSRMQAGGKSFTLAPVVFDAVPGGEIDLTMVAPVAGAPEGVVRGPRGTSLESIIVDGSELVFTAVDDAGSFEIARIPLDEMVRAEADAAADGVRDALAVDVAASQSARDAAEGHADRAATSESNAAASENAAKQSEDNAGDFAAVATTAATEAVDAMESASDAASSIGDSVNAAAGHADRAEEHESGAAAYAQNASDAADRVGTAEQVGTWAQQAQDAADRIGTAETVEGWANSARDSASTAAQSESKAKEYRDAAFSAASSTADELRGDLINIAGDASGYATDASRSAARAKTSETNAATHEANSLSAAERAEFAAEETIQQVEGDFATRNYVDAAKWVRGNVPTDTTSIDQLDMGLWFVATRALAETLGLPDPSMGYLEIFTNWRPKSARWTPITASAGAPGKTYQSTTDSYGEWGPWEAPGQSRELDTPVDFNTLTTAGTYHRRYARDDTNQPTNAPGTLIVSDSHHPSGLAVSQLYMAYGAYGIFYRGFSTLGAPSTWVRLDAREMDSPRRDVVVSAGLARRGHIIGTGGLGAVCFRFDHHLQQFGDKVLPLLKQYRIPWSQAVNPGNIGQGNDTMSFETLTGHVHDSGGEIWNHGKTHSNFTNEREADAELGTSLADLRTAMPSVWIDSFAAYGSGDMMGLKGWDEPEKFWDTYGGRLLLAQHAFVSGLYPGKVRPLGGEELIGTPYTPIDTLSVSQFKSRFDAARDAHSGITFMLHPNRLDTSGYLTLAQFEEMLAYAAAERDAGRIRILSTAGRSMADASAPDRTLLDNADAGSINVSKVRSVSTFANEATLGVPHELEVWARADGDVTLDINIGSPTNPVNISETFTLNGAAERLSLVATPPLDATTQSVTITGTCTHTQIKYRPI